MKLSHIIGIIVIAVAIAVIASTAGDASSYVTFKEAIELAKDGDSRMIHVVGKLKKDDKGQIVDMLYNPTVDPNHFEFTLVDTLKIAQRVVYNSPKPQDFERSEQVVVVGNMQNNQFVADQILMKCPSKYQESEIIVDKARPVKAEL